MPIIHAVYYKIMHRPCDLYYNNTFHISDNQHIVMLEAGDHVTLVPVLNILNNVM